MINKLIIKSKNNITINFASKELKKYLEKITGKDYKILTKNTDRNDPIKKKIHFL